MRTTKLGTDLTVYTKQLSEYPEVNISERKIADQRRTIVKDKLLPQQTLGQLKEQARQKLEKKSSQIQNHFTFPSEPCEIAIEPKTQSNSLSITQPTANYSIPTDRPNSSKELVTLLTENIRIIRCKFSTVIGLYAELNPTTRSSLPKLKYIPSNV